MMIKRQFFNMVCFFLLFSTAGWTQKPYRLGTTAASFLEIGIGAKAVAMGDASVAYAQDMSAIYWNPAGLALLKSNEAMFMYQPWFIDVNTLFAGAALTLPGIGTLGVGIFGINYGDIDVTTLDYQSGTGEQYTASDYNFNLTYARRLVTWFSFGGTFKYISSKIWHSQASAMAMDLGVLIQTPFLSTSVNKESGMLIGMSISNYGTRMQYDGMELLFPEDISPDEDGNYQNLQAKYKMSEWELPLLFRIGLAVHPIVAMNHHLTVEVDGLHPNNNSEFVNLGTEYKYITPGFGEVVLRAGYKGLFMVNSNFGATFGGGLKLYLSASQSVNLDYAFRSFSVLGNVHCFSVGVSF
jgi:hypothetical protein